MVQPESNPGGVPILVLGAVFLFLDLVFVGLRVWARRLKRVPLRLSDYLIIVGLFFNVCNLAVGYALVLDADVGRPMSQVPPERILLAFKLIVPATMLWGVSICFIKLSVLAFYTEIIHKKAARYAAYVLGALAICEAVAVILGTFLICTPFSYNWDVTEPGGHCGDKTANFLAIAVTNMIIDFLVVLLPMPFLWGLQMSLRKKVAVTGILSLGLVVSVFSALRIWAIFLISPKNFTGSMVLDVIWAAMELLLGVVTACLPLVQPSMSQLFGPDSTVQSMTRLLFRSSNAQESDDSRFNHFRSVDTIGSTPKKYGSRNDDAHYVELVHPERSGSGNSDSLRRERVKGSEAKPTWSNGV